MAQRFFIAPYDKGSGLQTNVKPWLISDLAFSEFNNAYVYRGRVKKRFGSRWLDDDPFLSRFRIQIDTTDAFGNTTVAAVLPKNSVAALIVDPAIGQQFTIGDLVFTVNASGAGVTNMLRTGGVTATIDFAAGSGAVQIITNAGAYANLPVYFYPNLPVMGLITYEVASINDEKTIGFDTRFSYQYTAGSGWSWISAEVTPGSDANYWVGDDSQFFWGANWSGVTAYDKFLYVTNFDETDSHFMRWYNGTGWEIFRPQLDAVPNYLLNARLLIPFQNRLIALNTWEGPNLAGRQNYPNRCRFSAANSDPTAANAWNTAVPGNGNGLDAPINEAIITADFLRNRLIVYFERSTWELVYTGNQVQPFRWQQINTELGAEATFSVVPFDKEVLGVGNIGIHSCNGVNVDRIDFAIPDTVFNIQNDFEGPIRVYGIRDYFTELVYWSYADNSSTATQYYPNRVLVYNYRNETWAKNADTITAFGYFQPTTGITWDSTIVTWDDTETWENSDSQNKSREIIAGNQQGYTFYCDTNTYKNAEVLQITDIATAADEVTITCLNHNLRYGEFVHLDGIQGAGLTVLNNLNFKISAIVDANSFRIPNDMRATGTYLGGGRIARVSQINIKTKEYNFFLEQGYNCYVSYVDFLVNSTPSAEYEVKFFVSSAAFDGKTDGANNMVLLGTGNLDTYPYSTAASPIPAEENASRLWHPVYFQADGEFIQLEISSTDEQMLDVEMQQEDFELHAMCFNAEPTSYRLQ